ncbi:hypothetical protein KC19_2G271000 [Ceratodon purpureus]|uniref:Secreted protein n=1 Tax=Ceratodon purpureus TaxID=3225 RepID=A0A8T0J2C1_CERPU|nr:hypothetical protein KC19_2G271000 [Ceratodon purpureus]
MSCLVFLMQLNVLNCVFLIWLRMQYANGSNPGYMVFCPLSTADVGGVRMTTCRVHDSRC